VKPGVKKSALWVWMAAAAVLVACGDAPPEPVTPQKPPPQVTPPSEAELAAAKLTANMVSAARTDESPAAVTVKFELLSRPQAGEPLTVRLVFIPQSAAATLSATFVAAEGLAIAPSQPPAEFTAVEAGAGYAYELQLAPEENGVHYFTAVVQLAGEGEPRIQTFSVPVVVGPPG
jgi:hypothetical protein